MCIGGQWSGQLKDPWVSMNQVTLPVVAIIIITQIWNRKSKIKMMEKCKVEMQPQTLAKLEDKT